MQAYRNGYDDGVAANSVAELSRIRLACAAAAALEISLLGMNSDCYMHASPVRSYPGSTICSLEPIMADCTHDPK